MSIIGKEFGKSGPKKHNGQILEHNRHRLIKVKLYDQAYFLLSWPIY